MNSTRRNRLRVSRRGLLRSIRHDARLSRLPVLVLSAHASNTDARRVTEAGADGFITKPIAPTQLLERIAALLGLHWIY